MSEQPIIIIKKIKKVAAHGHHGGAWKVAYADFVTAMMAFFLLMWLLNSTSEEQKRGLSNYFGPYGNAQGAGGSGGVLGGLSVQSEGMWTDNKTSPTVTSPSVKVEPTEQAGKGDEVGGELEEDGTPNDMEDKAKVETKAEKTEREAQEAIENFETQAFKEAEDSLKQAIETIPELKEISKSLIIDNTPEGLRIQIVDQKGLSMFPLGGAQMHEHMKRLLEQIAKITTNLPNKLSISGHTDAKPYAANNSYSNWELSSDRANASRRILLNAGLTPDRIYSVVGKAETEPFIASDPQSERNRRISIVLRKRSLDQNKQGVEDRKSVKPGAPKASPGGSVVQPGSGRSSPKVQVQVKAAPKPMDKTDKAIMSSVDALLGTLSHP